MYIARKIKSRIQYIENHCENVSDISCKLNKIKYLNRITKLIGKIHDIGKYSDEFQEYILKGDKSKRGSVKHSIACGLIFDDLNIENNEWYLSVKELINNVAMCHHGIDDFVSPKSFSVKQEERIQKFRKDYNCKKICEHFFNIQMSREELKEMVLEICKDIENLSSYIIEKITGIESKEEIDFYINMIARYLMSILIDADSIDAENFEKDKNFILKDNMQELWDKLSDNLNNKLNELKDSKDKTLIGNLRFKISNKCFEEAKQDETRVYRLSVPMGMGKTLSSLRFAIEKCKLKNKDHIFYIAPFNSILEQSSKEIRKIVGDKNILEHHCDVVGDKNSEEEKENYACKIKNWDSPIIATSVVQFLNCLFGGKREEILKFHTLSNSVIIIDEIQFLPIKCTYIFNLAINFLSKICGTDIIICSATQPPLDELKYKIKDVKNIEVNLEKLPIRVTAHLVNNSFENENDFTCFIKDKIDSNCLIILNTKKCALKIYKKLYEELSGEYKVYYLSTNMCAAHRNDTLENDIKKSLANKEKIICVSTQLIEAGVDISFKTVFRSMCGMDSIVQSSGRCNRHNEYAPEKGNFYVVKFFEEFEKIDSLEDIKLGKNTTEYIFKSESNKPNIKKNNDYIFSKEIIDAYYNEYFYRIRNGTTNIKNDKMSYLIQELDSSILELLSVNTDYCRNKILERKEKFPCMMQAPKTAGENFQVIENGEKEDFVVYYKESKDLIPELYTDKSFSDKMDIIRKLQRYTVSLYKNEYEGLDYKVVYLDENKNYSVNILSEENYNEKFGVCTEKTENKFLNI